MIDLPRFILRRVEYLDAATVGVLYYDTGNELEKIAVTLERPWLNNARGISCIPHGVYTCIFRPSRKMQSITRKHKKPRKYAYELQQVKARSNILIHHGNRIRDSRGCILLGTDARVWLDEMAVGHSVKAYNRFIARLADDCDNTMPDKIKITIIDYARRKMAGITPKKYTRAGLGAFCLSVNKIL